MNLWPHQIKAIDETQAALRHGYRRPCIAIPTGGGKTVVACNLIDRWLDEGHRIAVYTNRRMLVEQLAAVMARHGLDYGVRAAGWSAEGADFPLQICSIQTEDARVYKRKKCKECKGTKVGVDGETCWTCAGLGDVDPRWQLHDATRVLIDEAHLNTGDVARKILDTHHEEGASYVGLTATPTDLGGLYDCLLECGTTGELQACGALVKALHYGPDEPDTRPLKGANEEGRDFSAKELEKVIEKRALFGRVLEWFAKLNPERRPSILFAPGVPESLWFAEQLTAAGIPAAHIDANNVWLAGERMPSDADSRKTLRRASERGDIVVICNRFVMREGVDFPWLSHLIFATVLGDIRTYLQSGGRGMRVYPGKECLTVQDHGGNWWRHGSLNADRHWQLGDTAARLTGLRFDRLRHKQEREPSRCPQCARILAGARCFGCGWEAGGKLKSRPVVQHDGELLEMVGDIVKPRRITKQARQQVEAHWARIFWGFRKSPKRQTFRQAEAWFAQQHNWGWPPRDLPLMPTDPNDWFLPIADVPLERLTSVPPMKVKRNDGDRTGDARADDAGGAAGLFQEPLVGGAADEQGLGEAG